jgi:peptide/nickel transport system permease protein
MTRHSLKGRLGLVVGGTLMLLLIVVAIIADWVWGAAAETTTLDSHLGASAQHWFGTDALGRDVFARTMVATKLTMLMSFGAAAIASVAGIAIGSLIWISGPRVRETGLRIIDILISYPSVILALVVAAILGPAPLTAVLAIGLATAPAFARLTANLVQNVATRDFIVTARLLGVSPLRLLRRHLLPNVAEPLLVLISVAFTVSMKALTGLSFLGLGPQAPDYDWGSLLHHGLEGMYVNPAPALGPSLAIVLAGIAGGFLGDGLAALANPRTSGRGSRAQVRAALEAAQANPAAVVSVSGLEVTRPDGVKLVDGVSFSIGRGEIVGVVGESGSGKSLTAMSLAALLPDGLTARAHELRAGELNLLRPQSKRRLATEIGIVYQDPQTSFNPSMRVGAQITEALRVHTGASRAEASRRAVEQLELARVTLPAQRMKQRPHELSGGMRQRAMIASALLTEPKLLIADEPTTALDVTVQAEVLGLLRQANERGTSILFISHDIAVVASLCHRILVMHNGRIVEELSTGELVAGRAQHPYTRKLLAATLTVGVPSA